MLYDPGVQAARDQVETELGLGLSARLPPFRDRYDQAVAEDDAARLRAVRGQARPLGRICVLSDGHETSMEEPHWGRNKRRPADRVGGQRT